MTFITPISSAVSLSAVGVSAPIPYQTTSNQRTSSPEGVPGSALPSAGLLVGLSAGASLTYSVEVTGDAVTAPGYVASTGNWVPLSSLSALTAAAGAALPYAVTGIRLHVTSWTGGTATLQVVQ